MDIVDRLKQTAIVLRQHKCGVHCGWVQEAIKEIECLREQLALQAGSVNSELLTVDETQDVPQGLQDMPPIPKSPHEGTMLEGYLQRTDQQAGDGTASTDDQVKQ